jgi:ketosteroid isomerase-like protein
MSSLQDNAAVMLDIFGAIERRDAARLAQLFAPDAEFVWPPSLPYGGASRPGRPSWSEVWIPLQPTEVERKMDVRLVAAAGDEVVVLWQQRGLSPSGERFEGSVLGLYRLRAGRLIRAQMFYFDPVSAAAFLARVRAGSSR